MNAHALALLPLVLTGAPALGQWSTDIIPVSRTPAAALSIDGKALFAGGYQYAPVGCGCDVSSVDIYDPLAYPHWSHHDLSVARRTIAAATLDNYAFFAGGYISGTPMAVIDVYDASLGAPSDPAAWSITQLSVARRNHCAVAVGSQVLFAGGRVAGNGLTDIVDIYDASLGLPTNPAAWSTAQLSVPRRDIGATAVGGKAFFAGGDGGADVVDIYDSATGNWSTATLSAPRNGVMAVTVGSKALFAGGVWQGSGSDVVDVYDDATGSWSVMNFNQGRHRLRPGDRRR